MADAARDLARALGIHPLVARVLANRGLVAPEGAWAFLHPRLSDLTRPDPMADRDVAAARLADAVRRRERVVVFGDYDVDGITSAALLTRALRALGGEVVPLVASRFDGGYGLSDAAAERVLALRPGVLVTCDCGTSDHARLALVRSRGVDAIVVDHHKVPGEALPAVAFLNPQRPECGFPYKHLASVGLAFSIAAAVRAKLGVALDIRPYLDLVALGTVADVAPLTGDNRILTRAGLQRITDGGACPGVRALLREARLRYEVTARDVSFSLAPLLNAPGRLGAATPTLDLLLADDSTASAAAAQLADLNAKRRAISQELIEAALAQVRDVYGEVVPAGVVVAGEGWHPGMGGIVAGRLVERLGVPVAVVALDGEEGVGSVRGPRGGGLYDAVSACREHLVAFGGHDGAAGLTVRRDRVEAFRAAFAASSAARPTRGGSEPEIEAELHELDVSPTLARDLRALEPTGMGHPDVTVLVRGARLADARVVGNTHLRLSLGLGRRALNAFLRDGVACRERGEVPAPGATTDVVGRLRTDPWAGAEAVQIEVTAFRPPG